MSEPLLVSGLEIIVQEDEFELQIVNPRGKKLACGNTGFLNLHRQKEIEEWLEGKE